MKRKSFFICKILPIVIVFLNLLTVFCLCLANSESQLKAFKGEYEIYLNDSSSNAQIISISRENVKFYPNKTGEAVCIDGLLNVNKILRQLNARVILIEEINEGTCYYAFSPNVKYRKLLKGKTVNVQIFVGVDRVKIGTPIIYGSF